MLLVWKVPAGVIVHQIFGYLDTILLLPKEQKKRIKDLLFIDKIILRKVKMRKRNISISWIDYKKTYDWYLTRG